MQLCSDQIRREEVFLLIWQFTSKFLLQVFYIDNLPHRFLEVTCAMNANFRSCEFVNKLLNNLPESTHEPCYLDGKQLVHATSVIF